MNHTRMLPSISNLLISSPVTINLPPTSPYSTHLPPLEGDDPPQTLRLPSPCPVSPKIPFWNSPTPSYSSTSSSISYEDAQEVAEQHSTPTTTTPAATHIEIEHKPIPNTQIIFDSTGQAILKRRRGRPPTCNNNYESGGWTFLTPTVWDIHVSEEQKERELKADNDLLSKIHQHQQIHLLDDNMNESMNAFTNSNMDTLLQMPRKKRGRKPKTHIAGNSCFVWKDLTCTRSTIKK